MDIEEELGGPGRAARAGRSRDECRTKRVVGFAHARFKSDLIVCAVVGVLALSGSLQASAALGGHADARPAAGASFTSRAVATGEGGSLTEFSDASGLVFAVAWKSPVMPALEGLLGAWAPAFTLAQQRQMQGRRESAAAHPLSLRSMSVHDGDLVAFSAGRPQAFWGYAYLRSAVPAGFDTGYLAQ